MFDDEILDKATDLDERAIAAKESEEESEKLINEFMPFMRSRVSMYKSRYDDHDLDALLSATMMAFYEAIQNFDIKKGHFFPFATRVIKLRIIDQTREISKHEGKTVSLDDDDEDAQAAQSAAIASISMRNFNEEKTRQYLAEEIEQFKTEIALWGITMDALVTASPKHKDLRNTYSNIVTSVIENPDIIQTIRLKRYFPIKAISKITGLPQKKLERARTFILASLIIKTGDYNYLTDYVN